MPILVAIVSGKTDILQPIIADSSEAITRVAARRCCAASDWSEKSFGPIPNFSTILSHNGRNRLKSLRDCEHIQSATPLQTRMRSPSDHNHSLGLSVSAISASPIITERKPIA